MATVNITLSPRLEEFVATEVTAGGFPGPGDFILTLLDEAQRRKAKERIDGMLIEGVSSGELTPFDEADWQAIHQEVQLRHARRNAAP